MADSIVEPGTNDDDPLQSRTVQRLFIGVSVVLLLAALVYVGIARWPQKPVQGSQQTAQPAPPPPWWQGHEYQVLYVVIALEVVFALYLWGVGPWSDVAAPSGVKKPQPAGQVPAKQLAKTAEARARTRAAGAADPTRAAAAPPTAHPPLGPPLPSKPKATPAAEGSN